MDRVPPPLAFLFLLFSSSPLIVGEANASRAQSANPAASHIYSPCSRFSPGRRSHYTLEQAFRSWYAGFRTVAA
jgi:hypothetical protein